jgi:hypothetical protein
MSEQPDEPFEGYPTYAPSAPGNLLILRDTAPKVLFSMSGDGNHITLTNDNGSKITLSRANGNWRVVEDDSAKA